MKIDIKVDSKRLPKLLKTNGQKLYLQTLRVTQNRTVGEARKIAAKTIKDRYGLPAKAESGSYSKPSLKEVLTTRLVSRIGGIQAGVPSRLFASNKRIGAIRFVEPAERKPIQQKGIPIKKRRPLTLRIGSRRIVSIRRFVQKGNSRSGALHVFRSKKVRKWTMSRSSFSSVYQILTQAKNQKMMGAKAQLKFKEIFAREFQKRFRN